MTRGLSNAPQPRRWLAALLALGLAAARALLAADGPPVGEGQPLLQYFSPRDYHGGTQCWAAVQDTRGAMHVGTIGAVLEYDGTLWRKAAVPGGEVVTALAYEAATDTVFVGAVNDLGRLETAPDGERRYVSLLDQVPADDRNVGIVTKVFATPLGVFFVGASRVLRWRDGRFDAWPLATAGKLAAAWAGGVLFVYNKEVGLQRFEHGAFVPASDDALFHRALIRSLAADGGGGWIVATDRDGLFSLRGDGTVSPRPTECDAFLKEKGIYRLLRLRDGTLALATDSAGLLLLDGEGRFRNRVDEAGGIRGGNVLNLSEDAEGGLWAGLQSGITRLEINSPLSILRAGPQDDASSTYTADFWLGALVLGGKNGLFRVVPADPATATGAHLEKLPGLTGVVTACCAVENGLLTVGTNRVALLGADGRLVPVAGEFTPGGQLEPVRGRPGCVYLSGEDGQVRLLRLDRATGGWTDGGVVAATGQADVIDMAPGEGEDLWLGTREHGLFHAQFPPGGGPAAMTAYFDRPGPLRGVNDVHPVADGGPLLFRALSRLYRLDGEGQPARPVTEYGERFQDGSLQIETLVNHEAGSLWVVARHSADLLGEPLCGRVLAGAGDRPPAFQAVPRKVEEEIGEVRALLPVDLPPRPASVVLLAGSTGNGVARLDVARWEGALGRPAGFATVIRRAATFGQPHGAGGGSLPITDAPLPYAHNSAHFEYAAGTLAFGATPRFQTRLAGFGAGDWSDPGPRTSVDYLNLPEGRYTFEVRARNVDGQLGNVASLTFRVLPPWYRSSWASFACGLAAVWGFWALLQWRSRWLRRRNAVLAAVVETRTAELRLREADLLRARDDADTANRAKSAFLANMSHELRTPLNAVLGYTQLLLKQSDLSARSRERVAVIGQSGGHLLALVNEVLDLSKIEAGKLALSRTDFHLSQFLDEVAVAFRPRLAEKGLRFTETRAPDLPAFVGTDPRRLRQVLFNLLGNAVKFTARGNVGLDVRPAGEGRVRFEVKDTGVGIEPGELRDIFLAFHQAGGQPSAAQGTGLGLAISQRLVELLGGRIEVESTPGRGSRFWFDLPLATGDLARESDGHARPDTGPGPVTGYEGAPRRLLLVDDVEGTRRVLRDFLQPLGFEIEEAADGAAALAACARAMPDAMLLDLRLGSPDGYEVARRLRAQTGRPQPGIIAVSASVFESDRRRALDAGCDDFMSKPLDMAQLLGALGGVLSLRWTQAAPPPPAEPADLTPAGDGTLPPSETDALLDLSLRGDVAGIRKHLEALRVADGSASRMALVRRLESLAVAYDMEAIHELLLAVRRRPEE